MLAATMTPWSSSQEKPLPLQNPTTTTQAEPTVTTDPTDAVIATLGNWQTMQTGGNIKLSAGSSFSSSVQVRMVRDKAIFISLRPMLGIEVGKLVITADSLYAVDKVHKRYIAEKSVHPHFRNPIDSERCAGHLPGKAFHHRKGLSQVKEQQKRAS